MAPDDPSPAVRAPEGGAGRDDGAAAARIVKGGNRGELRSRTILHTPDERQQNERLAGFPDQSGREYYIPLDKVVETIRERGAKRVGLQFPNGLRDRAWETAACIEKHTDAMTVISGDLCFGACDLVDRDLVEMDVDLLVHFGHFEMPHLAHQYKMPVFYVPVHTAIPLLPAAEAALPHIQGKRVAVTTVAQHSDKLQGVVEYLSANGVECHTSRGDARLYNVGQLIGCNYTAATSLEDQVDLYLYLGTGDFHPLGLAMSTTKDVVCADPFTKEVRVLSGTRDRFLKQRWANIARARNAQTFGILVSTKTGQMRTAQALKVKEMLEAAGREAYLIALRDIVPDQLIYFRHVDAFVAAACPRVPIDDQNRYEQPMLTIQEVKMALDPSVSDYEFDEINPKNYVEPIV